MRILKQFFKNKKMENKKALYTSVDYIPKKQLKSYFLNKFTKISQEIEIIENFKMKSDNFIEYKVQLKKKISELFVDSVHVFKSKVEDEFYEQNGIKYLIKVLKLDNFIKKENNLISETKDVVKKPDFDPFEPPFLEGQVLEENLNGFGIHRILFNKYPIVDEHVILVSREFKSQYTHLALEEIRDSLLLMNTIEGMVFFNGGQKSGASQPRKHIQAIPYKSLYNKDFGIFQLIQEDSNLENIEEDILGNEIRNKYFTMYYIKQFQECKINHILIKFSNKLSYLLTELLDYSICVTLSELIHSLYNLGLLHLDLINNQDQALQDNIFNDYSYLLTDEWMLLIPRKGHEVELQTCKLSINSIGFLLTLLVKTEESKEELYSKNILKDIFTNL
jgi:ATP adenylyltransferase